MLDMTNYLVFFHHLMETQRERILFSGINIVTPLKLDHNMLDNQLIKGISDHGDHCLKKIIIDVKSSYRNLRFQFFSRRADLFRSDALDWTPK